MIRYYLGNGDQIVRYDTLPEWTGEDAVIYAGNGRDDMSLFGLNLVLSGENGNDIVAVVGFDNLLLGGNGDDWLGANGRYNTLDGGRGSDFLLSTAGGGAYEMGAGNILIGGAGDDTFAPVGAKDLVVTNDAGDGIVSDGDVVAGVFDVIADYQSGDVLKTSTTNRVGQVGFDPYELPFPYIHPVTDDHQHLLLLPGEYAVFRGDLAAPGEFLVGSQGEDLLVVWDQGVVDNRIFQWGVVLDGFSNADAVWVA